MIQCYRNKKIRKSQKQNLCTSSKAGTEKVWSKKIIGDNLIKFEELSQAFNEC